MRRFLFLKQLRFNLDLMFLHTDYKSFNKRTELQAFMLSSPALQAAAAASTTQPVSATRACNR